MGIEIVLDMAVSAMADRVAVGRRDSGLTYRQLDDMAAGAPACCGTAVWSTSSSWGSTGRSSPSSCSQRRRPEYPWRP